MQAVSSIEPLEQRCLLSAAVDPVVSGAWLGSEATSAQTEVKDGVVKFGPFYVTDGQSLAADVQASLNGGTPDAVPAQTGLASTASGPVDLYKSASSTVGLSDTGCVVIPRTPETEVFFQGDDQSDGVTVYSLGNPASTESGDEGMPTASTSYWAWNGPAAIPDPELWPDGAVLPMNGDTPTQSDTVGPEAMRIDPVQYLPMPILDPDDAHQSKSSDTSAGQFVSYDISSGQVLYHDTAALLSPLQTAQTQGGLGARSDLSLAADSVVPRNFTNLSLITNPEDYPWRVNVKLSMTFPSGNYVGSGVLIDPEHVLTAGHCVYYKGAWATSITVVPAYDNGTEPYGSATATQLYSWTEWTANGSFDDDMGVIDLDRPVGALTGWHGYGYADSPSFYTGNTFYNPGYPAEAPYNGQDMYYWYGNFDSTDSLLGFWYGNEVSINKLSYGGQSGSGAYYIDGGNRYVCAVLSNGNSSWTNFPRITSAKFDQIGSFISGDTPSTFDLIPLDVNISPGTVTAGSALSSMNYLVHNYSLAAWSGTVNVSVYLSTNNTVSTSDTLLQTGSFSASFSAKSSVILNLSTPPTIPADTSGGNYWIGVILNVGDNNTSNNDTSGWDAAPITVVPRPTVTLSATDASASETGPNTGTVTVSRSGSTASALTVYYTIAGTASNGSDYNAIGTSVTIPAGSTSAPVTITPIDDTEPEASETVVLTLSANAAYAIGSPNSGAVTIADNDRPTVVLQVIDGNAAEQNRDPAEFRVYRNGPTTSALTVYYTRGGTATNGTDYSSLGGSVTIPAGSASAPITIIPVDDAIVEGPETVILTLSSNAAYSIGSPSSGTVTIADNDLLVPTLSINDASISEGDSGTKSVTVSGTVSPASTQTITVQYATADGTATLADNDYASASGTLSINPGATTWSLSLPLIRGDYKVESNDYFYIDLSNPTNATIGRSRGSVTITNDDFPGTVQFSSANYSVNEAGGSVTITVSRTGGLGIGTFASYSTSNGSAIAGSDYTSTSGTLAFVGGDATKTFTVPILNDTVPEGNETFNLALAALNGATLGSPSAATVTIFDDDLPTIVIQVIDGNAAEQNRDPAEFRVYRNGPTTSALTVYYGITGTATNTSDYNTIGTSVTIPAGSASAPIIITPIDDTAPEPSETVTLTLSVNAAYIVAFPSTGTATIVDNDSPGVIDNASGAGVTITGTWTASTFNSGYYDSNYLHDGNAGKGTKSVLFSPAPGNYQVSLWWPNNPSGNFASNVPVDIIQDGVISTVTVNQQLNGGKWNLLSGSVYHFGLAGDGVRIRTDGTNGYVVADAVKFSAGLPPEIAVEYAGVNIPDGDTTPSTEDGTDFGSVPPGAAPVVHTFTIRNTGTAALTTSGLSVPAGYTINKYPAASIPAGSSDTFIVQLNTTTAGPYAGDISFTNNDADGGDGVESPFNFRITGTVTSDLIVDNSDTSRVTLVGTWTASTFNPSYLELFTNPTISSHRSPVPPRR